MIEVPTDPGLRFLARGRPGCGLAASVGFLPHPHAQLFGPHFTKATLEQLLLKGPTGVSPAEGDKDKPGKG